MYIPEKFRVEDREAVLEFIRKHPFGLLLTVSDGEILDTHTPFSLSEDEGCLYGHIARANDQWKSWSKVTKSKVVFTGPHAYVSPNFYTSDVNVPTWNYTAISISGKLNVIDDETEVLGFLDQLVSESENSETGWELDRNDERYMKLLGGIVVFKISIDNVDASFKLNQNKTREDQQGVIRSLQKSGCPFDHEVADMMEKITNK
ncbi:MAG: FMN-binding negative transcriptional regulator [Akkermansiaceae bacterium]